MEEHPATLKTMPSTRRAEQPFRFYTSVMLQASTGLRAATLPQLVQLLREAPEGCVYYHTHYFLLQHHYLTEQPTNDFTYWVDKVLDEAPLAKALAGIDIMQYTALQPLRETLLATMEEYLEHHPLARLKFAPDGAEFFLLSSVHVVAPTGVAAWTLQEFLEALQAVSIHVLYFHMFDARLKLGQLTNDVAQWFEQQLGEAELAKEIAALEPYSHTLEALRLALAALIQRRLGVADDHHG